MSTSNVEIVSYGGTRAEAQAVCEIAAACGLGAPAPAEAHARLAAPTTRVWLARAGGQFIGFVATFETRSASRRRLEVDLLGVIPTAQGRGIGTALARQATAGCDRLARALIRLGNVASERAFQRAGFAVGSDAMELLILDCRGPQPHPSPASRERGDDGPGSFPSPILRQRDEPGRGENSSLGPCELLPVTTLTYRGAWLENAGAFAGDVAAWRALGRCAGEWTAQRGLELVGALLPLAEEDGRQGLAGAGYVPTGCYRFFYRDGEQG